jgi:hypothetical protein
MDGRENLVIGQGLHTLMQTLSATAGIGNDGACNCAALEMFLSLATPIFDAKDSADVFQLPFAAGLSMTWSQLRCALVDLLDEIARVLVMSIDRSAIDDRRKLASSILICGALSSLPGVPDVLAKRVIAQIETDTAMQYLAGRIA